MSEQVNPELSELYHTDPEDPDYGRMKPEMAEEVGSYHQQKGIPEGEGNEAISDYAEKGSLNVRYGDEAGQKWEEVEKMRVEAAEVREKAE